ncbi:unnamed protein product, partial [marine sediment metagenome]
SENNMATLKSRLRSLGGDLDTKTPIYFARDGVLINQQKKVNEDLMDEIKRIIKEKNIKLLLFDTLHRFCFYDENKSDDLNLVYTKVFRVLQEMGVSVWFLHHSSKGNKTNMRGSGDILGQVDCAYMIERTGVKSNSFKIKNPKRRSGEIEDIHGQIDFKNDLWSITCMNESQIEKSNKQQIESAADLCISHITEATTGISRKELVDRLSEESKVSIPTIDRALNKLKERGLIKVVNRKYMWHNPTNAPTEKKPVKFKNGGAGKISYKAMSNSGDLGSIDMKVELQRF